MPLGCHQRVRQHYTIVSLLGWWWLGPLRTHYYIELIVSSSSRHRTGNGPYQGNSQCFLCRCWQTSQHRRLWRTHAAVNIIGFPDQCISRSWMTLKGHDTYVKCVALSIMLHRYIIVNSHHSLRNHLHWASDFWDHCSDVLNETTRLWERPSSAWLEK